MGKGNRPVLNEHHSVRLDRVPPQDIDVERTVLGAMLMPEESSEAIPLVVAILSEEDYYRGAHQKIHHAILDQFEKGEPVDLLTVTKRLEQRGDLEKVGGVSYLDGLIESVPTAANVEYYALMVKEEAMRRALLYLSAQTYNECFDETEEFGEIIDRAEKRVMDIRQGQVTTGMVTVKSLIKEAFEHVDKLYRKEERVIGLPTGFLDLDRLTSGFQDGDFIIVAGPTSVGKSVFVQNIIQYATIEMKIPAILFSLEMSAMSVVLRLLSSEARVDLARMRTGFIKEAEWPRFTIAAGTLSEAPIIVDDTSALSCSELRAKCHQAKSKYQVGLIVVDYLQLLHSDKHYDTREREVSNISGELKAIGRSLNVPLIACSQLSRASSARTDKRPVLTDLRDSGRLEQDADLVAFLYRENYYDKKCLDSTTEVILAKQRNGPIGTVELGFNPAAMKFLSREHRDVGVE